MNHINRDPLRHIDAPPVFPAATVRDCLILSTLSVWPTVSDSVQGWRAVRAYLTHSEVMTQREEWLLGYNPLPTSFIP
jgi:hypothetical protein